ncbi:WD repeat-containing protein DWA2-like [Cucurbita maxima]|uniref:WD repeat-containing protein DWA2-like n=1 Tax=Cucurbita maxima TaxID=3661 RepID=A0A6J1KRS5_CUCMA|nr:WD repeat-containing protein DWA2-like [Cucurbita maxima]
MPVASAMQGGSSGIGYGLKYQARSIADVKADTDHTSFITGTLSLKDVNEVHLIRLSSSGSELICEGLFSHPNEIWDLASCPFDQRIFSTVFSTVQSTGLIRNVDYNPKRKHLLVTAVEETGISLWDLRKPKVPIQQLPGQTHWTCAARSNPEHDGLILSAGTHSAVSLWLPSVCNGELKSERSVDSPPQQGDPLLHSYSDYEDSVYGLAWSFREPWIFASLSYDGRVVVESVKPFLSR